MENLLNIYHFSDLHISEKSNSSIIEIEEINNNGDRYIAFKNAINKEFAKTKNNILIVSGDIADTASENEYQAASKFFNDLDILNERIFIIPGNHDINEKDNTTFWCQKVGRGENCQKFESIEKYNEFSKFYESVLTPKKFNANKIIIDKFICDSTQTMILFLNSCSKCYAIQGDYSGMGFINVSQLENEIEELSKNEKKYSTYNKFICFHQNIEINYTLDTKNGFETQNRKNIEDLFKKEKIKGVIYGHQHTGDNFNKNGLFHLNVDSLLKNNTDNKGFNLYSLEKEDKRIVFKQNIFSLRTNELHNNSNFTFFILSNPTEEVLSMPNATNSQEIIANKVIHNVPQIENKDSENDVSVNSNKLSEYSEKLLEYVKKINIVKTGHFHWSDTSRAHNWIDIPQLLNKKKYLDNIQNWILDIKNKNNINPDLIIALGLEGNLISVKVALENEIPFSYLPYSYRYNDHTPLEKELKIESNLLNKVKSLLIITDVVHDGKTIKNIGYNINEDENIKKLFNSKTLEKVYIISMFFTGTNFNRYILDEKDKKYELYPITQIHIVECPYDNNEDGKEINYWKTKCDIYCNKLDKIYKFYNEN